VDPSLSDLRLFQEQIWIVADWLISLVFKRDISALMGFSSTGFFPKKYGFHLIYFPFCFDSSICYMPQPIFPQANP